MDAFNVLEKSYYIVNRNFNYYKKNFAHTYYLDVQDDETKFIDKLFKNTDNILSAGDKMLNYSISAIYTATAVLLEVIRRNGIEYTENQLGLLCKGFVSVQKEELPFIDKTETELNEILFGLLTDGIDLDSRKKSGSERTPEEIIRYMLDIMGYNQDSSISKSIVDPACGTGTFMKQIIDRFIDGIYKYKLVNSVKELLIDKKMICAYDTKPSNVYVTKIVVISTLINRNIISEMSDVLEIMKAFPIYCKDFLSVKEKKDFVVGNPPYIRLQNMTVKYRNFIKNNFVCATGRFDIFTCFMEKADKILNENGKMCLITSNKYLTANYGIGIREYLSKQGHVRKIIDLYDTKFFGAAVLPAIILCENKKNKDSEVNYIGIKTSDHEPLSICENADSLFEYVEHKLEKSKEFIQYGIDSDVVFEVSKSKVKLPCNGKPWNFSSSEDNDIKSKMELVQLCSLSDIFDVSVGIKTTADSVFVKPMTESFVKEQSFESDVIFPLIQSFDVSKWNITWGKNKRDRYILYPHKEISGNMVAIPLEDMPITRRYLEKCSDILKKRTYLANSKNRMWYECWVPQKLSKFRQTKIITRDIVSNNSFALDESGKLCQGNTFFLTKKSSLFSSEYNDFTEHQYFCFILGVLNSRALEYYQKMISGCLYSHKYRYTTSNLNRWPMPRVSRSEAIIIAENVEAIISGSKNKKDLERVIDKIIYKAFDLDDVDIISIEKLIGEESEDVN